MEFVIWYALWNAFVYKVAIKYEADPELTKNVYLYIYISLLQIIYHELKYLIQNQYASG